MTITLLCCNQLRSPQDNMLPPGIQWSEITLGMLNMVFAMLWKKNKRRIYIISLVLLGIYVAKKGQHLRERKVLAAQMARRRMRRTAQRDQQLKLLQKNEIFSASKDNITRMSFAELQKALTTKELTATEVMEAYLMKAAVAHAKTNCIVDVIEEAKEQSRQLDKNGDTEKLLFGIPVSIKESIHIKGKQSNMGCSYYLDKVPGDDSAVVKILKYHGAVPFVKTNIPQTMMSYESSNPIYGRTVNPYDTSRTCGGSSGGEAALIACNGSILGIGTDIGGSIRVPAHMCGICGIKPTVGRNSKHGGVAISHGQTCVSGTYGPMARDVNTLVIGMKAILSPLITELDFRQPYIPFNDEIYNSKEKLNVGYYTHDGCFYAVPSCKRAVEMGAKLLAELGHTVTEWNFGDYGARGYVLAKKAFTADGAKAYQKVLLHDKIDDDSKIDPYRPDLPVKRAMALHKAENPKSIIHDTLSTRFGVGSVGAYFDLNDEVTAFQDEVVAHWNREHFDVVICPGYATTAPKHGWFRKTEGVGSYTLVYNVLNFPAGVVPITKVTSKDLELTNDYPVIDESHRVIKESLPGSEGLPVGIQVVALPWQEEQCLRVMKEIETAVEHGIPDGITV